MEKDKRVETIDDMNEAKRSMDFLTNPNADDNDVQDIESARKWFLCIKSEHQKNINHGEGDVQKAANQKRFTLENILKTRVDTMMETAFKKLVYVPQLSRDMSKQMGDTMIKMIQTELDKLKSGNMPKKRPRLSSRDEDCESQSVSTQVYKKQRCVSTHTPRPST